MPEKKRRIVILSEGYFGDLEAKTASGLIMYKPEDVVAVLDSTQAGKTVQKILGFGGDIPVVAGFLYLTNSNIAWMEWIISNKDYKDNNRKEALKTLILGLENIALSVGKDMIFNVSKSKSLINIHKELGYTVDESPSYEISKKLI